ncbi:hypothetical protein [Pseudomonas veronii]
MKPTRSVRLGRICKKHPAANGLRYVGNNNCVECAKEQSRKNYASLEMTPAQKITTLLGEVSRLKTENEELLKDARRLDWLDGRSRPVVDGQCMASTEGELTGYDWGVFGQCSTVREAIDYELSKGDQS